MKFTVEIPRPDEMVSAERMELERAYSGARKAYRRTRGAEPPPSIPDRDPAYLGTLGTPVELADAITFDVRTPTILDEQNISVRVRELAMCFRSDGKEDPLAYANMLAGKEILRSTLRDGVRAYLFPEGDPEADLTDDELENVADTMGDLARIPELRHLLAVLLEIRELDGRFTMLDTLARWYVLTGKEIEEIPGWEVHWQSILEAYRKAERKSRQNFTRPSATSAGA